MNDIFVTKPSMPPLDEFIEEMKDVWASGIVTHQGPKHEKLRALLLDYFEVPGCTLFTNGHMALELAIKAFNLSGEIITTPFTFGSTTQAILRNNITPVFCDIKSDDYTMDPSKIEALITDKTTAIIPVHVYGNICDVDEIQRIANKYRLKVIYDAAHAFGETYHGRNVATFGDASMFSFHGTKVFHTIEGGCLTYHDTGLTPYLDALKQFGQINKGENAQIVGTNAKMTEISAAMGICNFKHFDEYIDGRRKAFEKYIERLKGIDGLVLPKIQDFVVPNYIYFPVIIEENILGLNRDEIFDRLEEKKIHSRKYFYPLCSDFDCLKDIANNAHVPVAEEISKKVLTLPLYSSLSVEEVDYICDQLLGFLR